jgi:hypothetical protein
MNFERFLDNCSFVKMPLHKTKFNPSWLEKLDFDGTPVKRWLKQGEKQSTFICTLCKIKNIQII